MSGGKGGSGFSGGTVPGFTGPAAPAGNQAPNVAPATTTAPNVSAPQTPNVYSQAANAVTGGLNNVNAASALYGNSAVPNYVGWGGVQQAANMYGGVNPVTAGTQGWNQAAGMYGNVNPVPAGTQGWNQAAGMYGGIQPNTQGFAQAQQATDMYGNVGPIAGGIDAYMNPYESQVINNFGNDLQRQTTLQQQQNATNAAAAGAFGGGRHGLVEAQTNEAAQRTFGDYAGQLRQQGFNTAAGLANQDIQNQMGAASGLLGAGQLAGGLSNQNIANQMNAAAGIGNISAMQNANAQQNIANQMGAASGLGNMSAMLNQMQQQNIANQMGGASGLLAAAGMGGQLGQQGFDMGQAIQQQQMAEGGLLQGLQQMLLDNARGMFQGYTNSPLDYLNARSAAISGSPLNNARTQTDQYNPGLFDYLSLGMQGFGTAFPGGISGGGGGA